MPADRNLPFGDIFGRAARDLLYGAKPANKSGNGRVGLMKRKLFPFWQFVDAMN